MPAKELITAALRATNKTQAEAAAKIGWSPQRFSAKMTRNTFKADEFLKVMESIGVEVSLSVKETGRAVKEHIPGAGRRVKRMLYNVIYDTAASDALANNFYADGKNKYNDGRARELYVTTDGKYFFAEYSEKEGEIDRINLISGRDAADFIEKHGTEIYKTPEKEE